MKRPTILTISILLSVQVLFGQSKTVAEFQKVANGYDLYIYQSVIRLLNKDKAPDFNMLIRDLDHLKLITTKDIGEASVKKFRLLDRQVVTEGYEEVMAFDSKESKCHLYEQEETWVATFQFEGFAGVFEMKGSLDLKYASAFNSLDMDRLKDMLPLDEMEQDLEQDH